MKNRMRLAAVGVMVASMATAAFAQDGEETYKAKCAMCHAADGSGATPAGRAMKVPAFSTPELVKESTADLIAATKNGKGKMPAYSGKLTDGQITAVVTHIRTLQKK
jgi:mono/diheme cytochrome c family protein